MLTELNQGDDDPDEPELITDPIIKRYANRLHALTWELIEETEALSAQPGAAKATNRFTEDTARAANLC